MLEWNWKQSNSLCSPLHSFPQSRNFQETNVEGGEGAISNRQWESQMDLADFAVCSTNHRVVSPFCHQCLNRKTQLDWVHTGNLIWNKIVAQCKNWIGEDKCVCTYPSLELETFTAPASGVRHSHSFAGFSLKKTYYLSHRHKKRHNILLRD